MTRWPRRLLALAFTTVAFGCSTSPSAPASFRFVSWADTKTGTAVLQGLSTQVRALGPAFTLYAGDLEASGFTTAGMNAWKAAVNGGTGNGVFDITFAVRGNHDSSNVAGWTAFFDMQARAAGVGATRYTALDPNLSYSFDYQNSHFAGLDVPGDFPAAVSQRQLAWLDADLASAESRGLKHAFLFWHGPIYSVTAEHAVDSSSGPIQDLIAVTNRHPIVTAMFVGHEHLMAQVHIAAPRVPNVTHAYEQFTLGTAGAEFYDALPGRGDSVVTQKSGFATVDVAGSDVTVTWYVLGSATPQQVFQIRK
jgi:hypothetical protein